MPDPEPEINRELLREALKFAVPMRIEELRNEDPRYREARRSAAAKLFAHYADTLLYRGRNALRRSSKQPIAFAGLSTALAYAALEPGGTEWGGVHWCAAPHPGCPRAVPHRPEMNNRKTTWDEVQEIMDSVYAELIHEPPAPARPR